MIDVLFVNPPSPDGYVYIRDINRSGRRTREQTIWPQTGLAYLAAVLADKYSVDIVDCIAEEMTWEEFEKYLKDTKPRYVVTNVITSIYRNDLHTTEVAKEIDSKTIAVGPHVTELPKETLTEFPSLDYIIRGEAEITIRELIDTIENGSTIDTVEGIAFRKNGDVKVTKDREFVENLDDLPFPLHNLLPLEKYNLPFIGSKYTFVLASRGCPYECTYCRQPIMWKRRVRTRSAESIFKELVMLTELGVKNFMFHSDTFTINKNVVVELCKKMVEANLDMRWVCNSRVDTVDEEMLSGMKKAGCWMVAYGIESGSQNILDNVKKSITIPQIKKAIKMTKDVGISVWGYFVMGLPGETHETIEETISLAKELPLDLANFAIGAPYPGTEFFKQAEEKGWLTSLDWENYDQNYSAVVSYDNLSSEEILNAVKKAYKVWLLRPKTIVKVLTQMRGYNDLKAVIRIGLDHIRMTH